MRKGSAGDSGDYLIPRERVTFAQAFPTVEDVRVEWNETGRGADGKPHRFTREYFQAGVIACSNPLCDGGGVDTTSLIRDMARERKADAEHFRVCRGAEKAGRRTRGPCNNSFDITIHIDYKTEPQEESG